jgi:hypothetical protein
VRKIVCLAAALLMAVAGVAQAAPEGAADLGPSAGGISSDNVEFIKNIPLSIDGVGGRVIGDYFYTNDQNKVMIFDITDPENPEMTGFVPMPQEVLYSREDIDGNGDILVVPNQVIPNEDERETAKLVGATYIIDVEDKSNPTIIAKLPASAQHTMSCILNCKWAYGSDGNIIDLRNPTKPKIMKERWGDGLVAQSGHDVTEVAPGIVLTSTQPIMLLDARKDPLHPKLLASGMVHPLRGVAEQGHRQVLPRRWRDEQPGALQRAQRRPDDLGRVEVAQDENVHDDRRVPDEERDVRRRITCGERGRLFLALVGGPPDVQRRGPRGRSLLRARHPLHRRQLEGQDLRGRLLHASRRLDRRVLLDHRRDPLLGRLHEGHRHPALYQQVTQKGHDSDTKTARRRAVFSFPA